MTIGMDSKSAVRGSLTILAVLGCGALYAFITAVPLGPSGRSGDQILLLLFAPALVAVGLYYLGRGAHRVWDGLTRFELTDRALTIRSPVRMRVVPWTSVEDFLLPPAGFPRAPESLVLLVRHSRAVALSIRRVRAAGAVSLLTTSVRGLGEWGLERVRPAGPTALSPMKVRWQLYQGDLFPFFIALVLFLLFTVGGLLFSWEFINYQRLRRSHVSTLARITEITREKGKNETVWTRVSYQAQNGRVVRLHREVMVPFADHFHVGDNVPVDYLPNHPRIARIPGWDLDDRRWVWLILVLPVVWVTYGTTKRGAANWLRPLRERLAWAAAPTLPHCTFSGADLQSLYPLFPDRHHGTLVLKPPSPASKKPGVRTWRRWFERAGISARPALDKFLILSPPEASRALERLGGGNDFVGGYMVLDCQTSAEAERLISEQLAKAKAGEAPSALEHVRFYYLDRLIGPLDDAARRVAFQAWIIRRLSRLYGGLLPNGVPQADFASLFGVDPADGIFDLLIERRNSGPRVWIRSYPGGSVQLAECDRGRWVVLRDVPAPRIFRATSAQARLASRALTVTNRAAT